ncbi:MAG: hypothetical protein A3G34_03635 [Candidatus Lindowbacteria bacterium RIFCSPLOWO2_12_FULL_62_27]|nr:MAG: hypothetical protein A3G34_03635 [Candidatus Lindowbacteria bacterium RIFCSPLOWO2_12_FULL_62_27]OGH61825.1 MAG: hypothetical protein A3I06_09420 [Candidatus Lindowbacteria bacterium RIFCSPLOWO2_02_FULL_62_12]
MPPNAPAAPAMSWWESLRHFGFLLGPGQVSDLERSFSPPDLAPYRADQLRREITRRDAGDITAADFAAWALDKICGFADAPGTWRRGRDVSTEYSRTLVSGETAKPRHIWSGLNGGRLPVFFDEAKTIGVGRSRKIVSDVVQWMRLARRPLALITNGRQWRLIYAGLDYTAACEWDTDLWFAEGQPGPQIAALRMILQAKLFDPSDPAAESALVAAILAGRKGQSELSAILGERVREAVECLVRSHGPALDRAAAVAPPDIYRGAVRTVMRLVVVLFAESRELLPLGNPLYYASYSLRGIFERLQKSAVRGRARLDHRFSAWPAVLALFRLIHDGSHHESVVLPAYGGELFQPGDPNSPDGVTRALVLFESACFDPGLQIMPDGVVYRMLELLTRTTVRIRQGRAAATVAMPVDFSGLSSEYIGILYEGLMDYELRKAPPADPVVFLNVGNQPALPLSRLEQMDDRQIKDLFEKMKKTDAADEETEEESEETDEAEAREAEPEADESDASETDGAPEEDAAAEPSASESSRGRAMAWARRVCLAAGLVRNPRGRMTPELRMQFDRRLDAAARQLTARVVLPGEWFLVRWGGTRKGGGTFYTRPALAVPTAHRTLAPLAFTPAQPSGPPDTPKKPEEILSIKVCDPACGSGSFLVAALRFLTDALYASLFAHRRLAGEQDRTIVNLFNGAAGPARLGDEWIPCRVEDADFESRLKARLRRHVVERCVYGVDLDPLAIELCRLALWIETMDRDLPFSFLDHKIKCGNSLVGCWLDRFRHYPVLAWNREGGDKGHGNGVHFEKETRTRAIKAFKSEAVKDDLAQFLGAPSLFRKDAITEAETAHAAATKVIDAIHEIPLADHEERARIYREEYAGSAALRAIRESLDRWCAIWFWPADALEDAPLPSNLHKPSERTAAIARAVAAEKRFFHWEIEFPDAFNSRRAGFDAILGNPPWDIAKPNSKEFFSNIDPLYRSYGKQEAVRKQTDYFADDTAEREWLDYNADFKAQSNFVKFAASPWGDPKESDERFSIARGGLNDALHDEWRSRRAGARGYADPEHSFRHQGSADINLYKLFLELGHSLLRSGGRLGFIVPSGLYSDHGSGALRELFLNRCRWEWIFGFENREKIFDIDGRFKFNPVIIEKGGTTEAIKTAFMRRKLEDWENGETFATLYTRERVTRFSPKSKAILEIQSDRDLEILEKIYANSVLLGADGPDGWGIKYATEFHMTNDSKLFPPRPWWEERGYQPDEYSRWQKGEWRPIADLWRTLKVKALPDGERRCAQPPYDTLPIPRADIPAGTILSRDASHWIAEDEIDDTALPLYEGRMIGQFDFSQKGWVSGKGRSAEWREIPWDSKQIEPQFCMGRETFLSERPKYANRIKFSFMDVSSATNSRTMIGSVVYRNPCGNKVPALHNRFDTSGALSLCAIANSFLYDFQLRCRFGGLSLNYYIIEETELPHARDGFNSHLQANAVSLMLPSRVFAPIWLSLGATPVRVRWQQSWAVSEHERIRRLCSLDSIVALNYGMDTVLLRSVLTDCDHPATAISSLSLNPKGFWRVDKEKDPELRHTVLTLVAFHDLQQKIAAAGDRDKGIEAFCNQNAGEGWMLPETLRLADYGLGHDDRAKIAQPVAGRLGPRFLDWQLAQSPEESWRECELHARNLLGEAGFKQLQSGIDSDPRAARPSAIKQEPAKPARKKAKLAPNQATLL